LSYCQCFLVGKDGKVIEIEKATRFEKTSISWMLPKEKVIVIVPLYGIHGYKAISKDVAESRGAT